MNYEARIVRVGNEVLCGRISNNTDKKINVSIKKFQKAMKQEGTKLFAILINSVGAKHESFGQSTSDAKMIAIIDEFSDAFKTNFQMIYPKT